MVAEHHNPLDQFKVKPIIDIHFAGIDLSFTNSSLYMVIALALITLFFTLSMSGRALIPNRWQSSAEVFYEFIASMLKDTVGYEGRKYFPFIFTVFMFIATCNLLGMTPYSFTVTSHIIVTFGLALIIFFGLVTISFARHGLHFFSYFLPQGTPLVMAPLMILIEFFAFLVRPVSLSIRLAANMMAGHVLLKVLAGFITTLGVTLGWVPLLFVVGMTGFEIFIALLQAYIFTILTCVYLTDAVHLH